VPQQADLFCSHLYYCPGSAASCAGNNGNVLTHYILPLNATVQYTYDTVNRIASATEGSTWFQDYSYDAQGNRAVLAAAGAYIPNSNFTPQVPSLNSPLPYANNQWSGAGYDTAGNLNTVNGYTYTYDAENRQTQVVAPLGATSTYNYDGGGRRVQRVAASVTTTYVYDAQGLLQAEYGTGELSPSCQTCYLTADHLGSTRVVTSSSGAVVSRHDYVPFGEELFTSNRTPALGYATDTVAQKFTAKERDAETGLDWFNVRYFSAAQGRFTSPDQPFIDQDPSNPQSWNLYNYGRNNPLRYSDPTGRKCVQTSNGQADDGTGGGCEAAGVDAQGNITPQTVNAVDITQRGTDLFVNGRIAYEGGIEHDYAADFGLLGLLRGAFGGLLGGAAAESAGPALFDLAPIARGNAIEQALGANLPRTFPTFDKFINGVATSIKSIDLRAVTYQNPANLERVLTNYVDKVADFTSGAVGRTAIEGSQISGRVLEVAVPQGATSAAQQAVLSRVTAAAAQRGVQVITVPIR
jgi:RHS repeat-associated protein